MERTFLFFPVIFSNVYKLSILIYCGQTINILKSSSENIWSCYLAFCINWQELAMAFHIYWDKNTSQHSLIFINIWLQVTFFSTNAPTAALCCYNFTLLQWVPSLKVSDIDYDDSQKKKRQGECFYNLWKKNSAKANTLTIIWFSFEDAQYEKLL